MKSKKAQAHIEIILSFLIFIGALIAIFIFINPLAKTPRVESNTDYVQDRLIANISSEFSKLSVIINKTGICYDFDEAEYGTNYREVQITARKFDIYFSPLFELPSVAPNRVGGCEADDYELGIYSDKDIIFRKNIENLVESYNENYPETKRSLGVFDDFVFSFKNLDGSDIEGLSVTTKIPGRINVNSREFPVRVIDEDAKIQELLLSVKSWNE